MKIIVTGAAGLVAQNLTLPLRESGDDHIVAIDQQINNLEQRAQLNPDIETVVAELAQRGPCKEHFSDAGVVVLLHAQIGGKLPDLIKRNNLTTPEYRWFGPEHFGWLARLVERVPVSPIAGHGRCVRQPLYERDYGRAILCCIENRLATWIYDLVGLERIDPIATNRAIRAVKGLRKPSMRILYVLLDLLLWAHAVARERPPFTSDQLNARTAGDELKGVDSEQTFGIKPTSFSTWIRETCCPAV